MFIFMSAIFFICPIKKNILSTQKYFKVHLYPFMFIP